MTAREPDGRRRSVHGARAEQRIERWAICLSALALAVVLSRLAWSGLARLVAGAGGGGGGEALTAPQAAAAAFEAAILLGALALLRRAFHRRRAVIRRLEETERELREAEQRFRSLFENSVEGIFQTTPDGRYLAANPALARMYGYATPDDLVADVTDITRQIYVDEGRRADFARALSRHDEVHGFESRVRRRDGTILWISENARAVRDATGRLTHYEGAVVDITERKRAEEELRLRERELRRHRDHLEEMVQERTTKLRRVNQHLEREIAERRRAEAELRLRDRAIATVSEGIAITDPRRPGNPVVYVNHGFERLTGWRRAEVLGRSCRFLQGAGSDPGAVRRIRSALREERECTVEILNYRKDGTPFWNLLSITPVRDDDGRLVSFIGVQFDLTERKRIEQVKDDLVATVSHELRTPLSSLRGFTELMLSREFPAERRRDFLAIIHAESLRLGRLIDDLLDLQRMESGRQTYAGRCLELGPLVRETVRLFALQSDRHWLRLQVEDALPPVHADPDRIRQVLSNLLSNAVKFSPDGGEIGVGARRDGDGILVAVQDHGIGIEPQAAGKLFRKFHRLSAAEERGIGGTGLGLALVRQIVEGHGGRVGVHSRVGEGSTFWLWLPRAGAGEAIHGERGGAPGSASA